MKTRRIRNQILHAIANGIESIYGLIDRQDASLPEFLSILEEMKREGMVTIENGKVKPTDEVGDIIEGLRKIDYQMCDCCDSTGYRMKGFFSDILKNFEEIAENRPEAIEKFDQGFISSEGIIRRLYFIQERGDLFDSQIFVVGDDDLFSIAAALTGLPNKIQVGEIDERLVNFINRVAEEYSLSVEATIFDVQEPLPEKFVKKFDIFVMDPVETIPGLSLFLSRGVSSLKGTGCSGYFGITTLEASRRKWYKIEKIIHDMGFVITDLKRKFSVYPQTEKNFLRYYDKLPVSEKFGTEFDQDWYTSTLFRIEAVREPEPVIEGRRIIDEKFYKDDESWATPY
ncbi:MAG TPA: putative methyltransferase [Archaeoglobaceae archaeon]|nr:putative methyltransferase [Archaeoglobaceae archaeon]